MINKFAISTALSALVVAAPLAGAFAASAVPADTGQASYNAMIEARITAAEANLQPLSPSGFENPAAAGDAEGQLLQVEKTAAMDRSSHGGQLTASDYQSLLPQLQGVEQSIQKAIDG